MTVERLPIATEKRTKQLLQELHIVPNKSMGQNFLISAQVTENIGQLARMEEGCPIVEIGPGLGALSEVLAQSAASLCLVELDSKLCQHLSRMFADKEQVEIINADALRFDYAQYAAAKGWAKYQVVANLPYYITSQIIRCLLLKGGSWQRLTLMVQKEVAEKLAAAHPAAGGPLAVLLHYFGEVRLAFTVPPQNFLPPPEIQSAVLQVERWAQPPLALADPERFEAFLLAAYHQRRKTLPNSLNSALGGGKELWQEALKSCGISGQCRAEQLTLNEFGSLFALPQVQELLK